MATDSISHDDIAEAFARIEDELLASMMRNMAAHRVEELDSGTEWAQWQAVQLQGLHDYARRNNLDHGPAFDALNGRMEEAVAEAYERGYAAQEAGILDAIAKGWEPPEADMLRPSPHRLDALLKATHDDMMRAEHATLRRAEDIYRKTIFSAQLYATSGAGTYEKAIDMAVVDFLKKGVDGIVYRNGSRHTIREYSQMAVRTAAKRAAMAADGDARRDWGVHTIFVNYRADACPECMEWVGQVLVDDVYSGGTPEEAAEGGYALLSDAMAQGLFHPNCRDTQSTYFEGVNEPPKPFTPDEMGKAEEGEAEEQARSQAEQNARGWGRAAEMLLDPADRAEAEAKAEEWAEKAESVGDRLRRVKGLEDHADVLESMVESASGDARRAFEGVLGELDLRPLKKGPANYSGHERTVTVDMAATAAGTRNRSFSPAYETFFHEVGHQIDHRGAGYAIATVKKGRYIYITDETAAIRSGLGDAVKDEVERWAKAVKAEKGYRSIAEAYDDITRTVGELYRAEPHAYANLIDMVSGATRGRACSDWYMPGHSKAYWSRVGGTDALAKEAFAEFFSSEMANPRSAKVLADFLPESRELFMSILGGL